MQPGSDVVDAVAQPQDDTVDRIRETFRAMWAGRVESDGFNALLLRAALSWRQVTVLRSYSRYLRQLPLPYGQTRIQRVLLDNPAATRALLDLFEARFDRTEQPADSPHRIARIAEAEQRVATEIDHVLHIDADRILRTYHNLINATVRTNAFAPDALTVWAPIWFTNSTLSPSTSCHSLDLFPKSSSIHRNSKVCTFASDWWPAAGCAGRTATTTTAPRSSDW